MALAVKKCTTIEASLQSQKQIGIHVVVTLDDEDRPNSVVIEVLGRKSERCVLDAELVEQLGEFIHDLRSKAYDRRNICVEHGYYEPTQRYQCPTCSSTKTD